MIAVDFLTYYDLRSEKSFNLFNHDSDDWYSNIGIVVEEGGDSVLSVDFL